MDKDDVGYVTLDQWLKYAMDHIAVKAATV